MRTILLIAGVAELHKLTVPLVITIGWRNTRARRYGPRDGDAFASMPKFSEDIRAAVDFAAWRLAAHRVILFARLHQAPAFPVSFRKKAPSDRAHTSGWQVPVRRREAAWPPSVDRG